MPMTPSARITSIVAALDELLEPAAFEDLGPNGLQVPPPPGKGEASHVVTGVTAQKELFERAEELGAELVVVHHGLFWSFHPTGLTPILAERLRPLFRSGIALAAYHLPLDAHPEVGNNAILANRLGCDRHEPYSEHRGRAIGRLGTFDGGVPADELFARVNEVCDREPTVLGAGPDRVRRIGIVSGSAASSLGEAIDLGLDAFLTGEPRENVMADAREAGIHFIAAGHYATETFGVRRLGDWLAARFGVEHHWIDIPNPV
jgi:dinuclear metal center YbgI/SA1388 family protein